MLFQKNISLASLALCLTATPSPSAALLKQHRVITDLIDSVINERLFNDIAPIAVDHFNENKHRHLLDSESIFDTPIVNSISIDASSCEIYNEYTNPQSWVKYHPNTVEAVSFYASGSPQMGENIIEKYQDFFYSVILWEVTEVTEKCSERMKGSKKSSKAKKNSYKKFNLPNFDAVSFEITGRFVSGPILKLPGFEPIYDIIPTLRTIIRSEIEPDDATSAVWKRTVSFYSTTKLEELDSNVRSLLDVMVGGFVADMPQQSQLFIELVKKGLELNNE